MNDDEYDATFYGGKGKSKGKSRSFGKGKGRKGNPIGRDGNVMKCSVCNSDTHFRAECPQNRDTGQGSSPGFASYTNSSPPGPLGDLIYMLNSREAAEPTAAAQGSGAASSNPAVASSHSAVFRPPAQWSVFDASSLPTPAFAANVDTAIAGAYRPAPHTTTDGLGQVVEQRNAIVEQAIRDNIPRATVQLDSVETYRPQENFGMLSDFQNLASRRDERRRQAARPLNRTPPTSVGWERFAQASENIVLNLPPLVSSTEDYVSMPPDFSSYSADMALHQRLQRQRILEQRTRNQQRMALQLARANNTNTTSSSSSISEESDHSVHCAICQDTIQVGERIAILTCHHTFHLTCVDAWSAGQIEESREPLCPQCRRPLEIRIIQELEGEAVAQGPEVHSIATPPSSGYASAASAFPWWPAESTTSALQTAYHTATQLSNGQLSFIVDPGAWTNLVGAKLARALTERAIANGHRPKQEKMNTLSIQGVGNGSQACNWKLVSPIAVPHSDGHAHLHSIEAPIVEGTGEDLPGLYGLKSMEQRRAILDTGNKKLYFPGPGDVQIVLPPGSIEVPLQKAPSGHLVMVVDNFENLKPPSTGGLPEVTMQLHTAM
jgi:hypothetical protein